ncbi:hypothetical protein W97_01312 [Coniosporium apollinis CBS 100218]|uniref:Uncharacterized protein n=1 Tax=Coniosporium apollinis (strain CBS 100218) TaxID=1168221 RepID=R7YJQ5_CONA1|nr:uncharacterized protein W97_01312 [Coniosporium apollinis CBS 100218]EON62093.1 hypothetical protein W97_01312 [Coniosporium apollinis CBS 100218]
MAEVIPSNDPAFPIDARPTSDGRFAIDVYCDDNGYQTGALPFHPECFLIFVKALANACGDATITRFEDVDLGRLFECLSPTREMWLNCLTLDYGELMEKSKREQHFYIKPGMERDVTNPVDMPGLREVFERATKPQGFSDISDR